MASNKEIEDRLTAMIKELKDIMKEREARMAELKEEMLQIEQSNEQLQQTVESFLSGFWIQARSNAGLFLCCNIKHLAL